MNEQSLRAPDVTVVVVSYGSETVLPAFLDSLGPASSAPLRTIVVDNKPGGDGVESLAVARSLDYLPLENPGYGAAVNRAVFGLAAETKWLLITNPDVTMDPGSIDVLVRAGESDDSIGSVGPLIRDAEGGVYPSARRLPRLTMGTGHALFGRVWRSNPWSREYRQAHEAPFARDAEWLSGACLLVRSTAFRAIDGFDESFFMYFEDVDLGARLLDAGYRNRYEPAAAVTHTGAHSTERSVSAMVAAHHESAYRFMAKRYPGALLWPVRQALRLGLRVRSRHSRR